MLENLDPIATTNEFLYEMAMHTIDTNQFSVFYDVYGNDTIGYNIWLDQYNEVRYMAYDTSAIIPVMQYGLNAFNYVKNNDEIPLGLIHIDFNRLKSDALTTNNYFDFDLPNNTLYDLPSRPNEPYQFGEVASFAPLAGQTKSLVVDFLIDKSWFILDNRTANYYIDPGYEFVIDFGNNDTLVHFDAHLSHNFTKIYSTVGEKIITVKLFSKILGGDPIYTSKAKIRIDDNQGFFQTGGDPIDRAGLDIVKFAPCETEGNNGRKIAIVVEGFDFLEDQTAYDLYYKALQSTQIDELRKFGYEFHTISWKDSRIDMRTNAQYLIQYMDELKCELLNSGNQEPMVLIGASMGGIIARYALAYWENNPGVSTCFNSYLHFTRLLITLDSPHQGANIPLAYQHFYDRLEYILKAKIITKAKFFSDVQIKAGLLDTKASQQLLMYHVSTESGSNYSPHPERVSFMASLSALGNYPQHCKMVFTSSGSASGTLQQNPFTEDPREPGDKFFQVDGITYARWLWHVFPLNFVDLQMNSAGSSNQIFRLNLTQNFYGIKLFFFGVKFKDLGKLSPFVYKNASIHSYDVESGGNMNLNIHAIKPGFALSGWPSNSVPIAYAFNYNISLGPGKWLAGGEAGIGFVAALGAIAIVQSDGFDFCFVPMRSALDYGGSIYTGLQSPNIEITAPATVMNNTPADVVLAVPDRSKNKSTNLTNYAHSDKYNPQLYWKYDTDPILYRTCELAGYNDKFSYLLNREIGDEKLYLENLDQIFPFARYRAEIDVLVNERNPAYNYPTFKDINKNEPGAFSDDSPFTTEQSVEFVSDHPYAHGFTGRDFSDGFIYNSPQAQNWNYITTPFPICCNPIVPRRRNPIPTNKEKDVNAYWTYKNGQRQYLQIETIEPKNKVITFELYDINGRQIQKNNWSWNPSDEYTITIPNKIGMYLLRMTIDNKVSTLKYINQL